MAKDKEDEKMVRVVLAAVFALPLIHAREVQNKHKDGVVDAALELADELIRKAK